LILRCIFFNYFFHSSTPKHGFLVLLVYHMMSRVTNYAYIYHFFPYDQPH
jgi:hypothetical protein